MLINFFETILSWPVIHLVVRWGISHVFTATRNTTEGVEEKEQRTNERYGFGSTQSARRVVLWHCIPCAGVHLLETSTSYQECQLIFDRIPHCAWTLPHADCTLLLSVVDCPSVSPFANGLSGFSRICLPYPTSGLVGYLESKPFVWFRAKTDKGIVCFVGHIHSVTTR